MVIAGLKTRFLTELIEFYGEVLGATEQQQLLDRFPERHQKWIVPGPLSAARPEFLFINDVEELLKPLDDSVGGCNGTRFETAVAETMSRTIARRALTLKKSTFRGYLNRIIPIVEDTWPIRPPTIGVEETASGLRVTMAVLGYSRCTRLLAFQMLGAVKYAWRLASDSSLDEQHLTVDIFGDRARIDVYQRISIPSNVALEDTLPPSVRPSQRSVRIRPSLSEQVESILRHRSPSVPPPDGRPPTNAIGLAQLRRPSQPGFEAPARPSTPPPNASPLSPPRAPALKSVRHSTPPPSRVARKPTTDSPASSCNNAREPSARHSTSVPPPSRRGGQPK
jgi:hypothetical protein